jgi:hypothetical protein
LDEDEVEFLDSVLESTRSQEATIKKETNEQLALFHRQRQEAEQALLDTSKGGDANAAGAASPTEEEHWATTNRKRRRAKEKDAFRGVKLRKASSSGVDRSSSQDTKPSDTDKPRETAAAEVSPSTRKPSGTEKPPTPSTKGQGSDSANSPSVTSEVKKSPIVAAPSGLGLGAYSSDED